MCKGWVATNGVSGKVGGVFFWMRGVRGVEMLLIFCPQEIVEGEGRERERKGGGGVQFAVMKRHKNVVYIAVKQM